MNNNQLMLDIAERVRNWAEAQAHGTLKAGDLNGMCAIASAELWRQLAAAGIRAEIRVWVCTRMFSAHVFLAVDDHVLDVTATQFQALRKFKIYHEHENLARVHQFYDYSHVFDTDQELVAWQRKVGFDQDQIAWA